MAFVLFDNCYTGHGRSKDRGWENYIKVTPSPERMAKCEICGNKIDEVFLHKLVGTYVKDKKGKKHTLCNHCQEHVRTKEEQLKKL